MRNDKPLTPAEMGARGGRARSERKTSASRRNARKGAAARRGKPAVVSAKRIENYAAFIAGDYPHIAADLRQIAAGQDGDELWNVEVTR